MTFEAIVARFQAKRVGEEYLARCPAHEDDHPSLSISRGKDGCTLICCHAGCRTEAIIAAAGLTLADLFVHKNGTPQIIATYTYCDSVGVPRYRKHRTDPKGFFFERANSHGGWTKGLSNIDRYLYRLNEIVGHPTIFICEGEKDANRLWSLGRPATTNDAGAGKWLDLYAQQLQAVGVMSVACVRHLDGPGLLHMETVADSCTRFGIEARIVTLPGEHPAGYDISNWFDDGHALDELTQLRDTSKVYAAPTPRIVVSRTLTEVHQLFCRWFGPEYDMGPLDAMIATMAAERLDGDPIWLLIIGGPGVAKTETLSAASGAGALITSTIASEGALLSGTSKREKTKDATGGLLRKIGSRGVLVIKDVTTTLSMNHEARASVLAALREVYDGKWERNLGTNGGLTLTWEGRIAVMGAVTTAWDSHHSVVASMGDRFVTVRTDSTKTKGRLDAGAHALMNTGHEVAMRQELADAVGGVMASINASSAVVTEEENKRLLNAAHLVTLCRTSVECDRNGRVESAHAPEMPTRFAKQLMQIVRGARAVGMDVEQSMELGLRCARDSMPPLRLEVLELIGRSGSVETKHVKAGVDKPWPTVIRQLESLHLLGVLTCAESEEEEQADAATKDQPASRKHTRRTYSLAEGIEPRDIAPLDKLFDGRF